MQRHVFAIICTIVGIATFGVPISAQDRPTLDAVVTQTLEQCLAGRAGRPEVGSCGGIALDNCLADFPDEAVIPRVCWDEELAVWDFLLNSSYQALIADITVRDYATFVEPIRVSQRNWLQQRDLDCALDVASNPRTYDVILPACQARMTQERVFFLRNLFGADWTRENE